MFRRSGDKVSLCASLDNEAGISNMQEHQAAVLRVLVEQEQRAHELENKDALAFVLALRSRILLSCGNASAAPEQLPQEEQIERALGQKRQLASCLGGQANVLEALGELDGLLPCRRVRSGSRALWVTRMVHKRAFEDQASFLHLQGDLEGALALQDREERLCRELGDPLTLQSALGDQTVILTQIRHRCDLARPLPREGYGLALASGHRERTARLQKLCDLLEATMSAVDHQAR